MYTVLPKNDITTFTKVLRKISSCKTRQKRYLITLITVIYSFDNCSGV